MQQEDDGQQGYWATYFDADEVFYGHVLGCKGLERSAVVLCLNEDGSRDRARGRLYAACPAPPTFSSLSAILTS